MIDGKLVKIITRDGLELSGFWMDQKSDVAVFQTHGTAGDFYTHKFVEVEGEELAKQKISFLTANNRGHDVFADIRKHKGNAVEWTQIGGGLERFEDCVFDIEAWVKFLIDHGVKKIILQGHSLGPNKTIYYQYKKKDPHVIGFIHLSPQNDAGLMKNKLGDTKYAEVNRMIVQKLKEGKGSEMLPKELQELCPISVLAYSGYFIEEGVGNLFPYHNPYNPNWKIVGDIDEPQILIYGEQDPYIKPSVAKALEVFKQKTKAKFESRIIPGASHSYLGQEDELVKVIIDWIKRNYYG